MEEEPMCSNDALAQIPDDDRLLHDIGGMIDSARQRVAVRVNAELTMLYWGIGNRINDEVLRGDRAEYGAQVVARLAEGLTSRYGPGFTRDNLARMSSLASTYPDTEIVGTLSHQLTWSHFQVLIAIEDPLEREFYEIMIAREVWSVRTLRRHLNRLLYRRTVATSLPIEEVKAELATLREHGAVVPELAFRDPYVLDFLGLPSRYPELDLEKAIMAEIRSFLLELGGEFSLVAEQMPFKLDGVVHSIDLVFFHRGLRCLVAVELKARPLRAQDKGQMELYLRWLDRNKRGPDEGPPVGLILCTGKGRDLVSYMELDSGPIRASEYLTEKLALPALERCVRAIRQSREAAGG
jgi:predicted nuclease of restriction endonuclease-like (RecB) superfamily